VFGASAGVDFERRFRILEQLREVKIGVVLVDLIRTESGGGGGGRDGRGGSAGRRRRSNQDEDDVEGVEERLDHDVEIANDALEVLCDLVRALLNCVRPDHPPEVSAHASSAVAACLEEIEGGLPNQVLEELLVCVGRGPVVWVTNPAFAEGSGGRGGSGSKRDARAGGDAGKEEEDSATTSPHFSPPGSSRRTRRTSWPPASSGAPRTRSRPQSRRS
jgi:hypothetical protein